MKAQQIVIVGGGTAGWMAALIMANAWLKKGFSISLLESPDVGIIGVGEGSTPALKMFFDKLHIAESEWMPECSATYKCGITFDGWSTKPGYESYFHPFSSTLDKLTLPTFTHNAQARVRGADVYAHPDRFFLSTHLVNHQLAPKPPYSFPFDVFYGYHFDATLLGRFLRKKACELGVTYKEAHVVSIQQTERGDIESVTTKAGELVSADLFVDCTGFSSVLLQQTLGASFKDFASNLFNDAAVAMPTEISEKIPSHTLSTAMKHGWAWKIPLTNRFGNGYVYSSAFCSADQAEHELRAHLGVLDKDIPVRHLKMKVGRVDTHWEKNCVAVGLSQGFIEPLEATALFLVQQTVEFFVDYYEKGQFTAKHQELFNDQINNYFEGVRDYIVTHYKTSSRSDTEYWRANTSDPHKVSDAAKQLYNAWFSGENLADALRRLNMETYYPAPSWYCIFAGMGVWGNSMRLRTATADEAKHDLNALDNFLVRSASNFTDHRKYLEIK